MVYVLIVSFTWCLHLSGLWLSYFISVVVLGIVKFSYTGSRAFTRVVLLVGLGQLPALVCGSLLIVDRWSVDSWRSLVDRVDWCLALDLVLLLSDHRRCLLRLGV